MVLTVIFKFQITKKVKIHNNIQKIMFKYIHQKSSNIFCHIKFFYSNKIKNYFKKIHHHLLSNQSIELSSLSDIDNIIKYEEVNVKKNPTVGLPEVSNLIDSAISKRQGEQRKNSFPEKKILHKRENGFPIKTQKYHITMKESNHQFHKIFVISQNV